MAAGNFSHYLLYKFLSFKLRVSYKGPEGKKGILFQRNNN